MNEINTHLSSKSSTINYRLDPKPFLAQVDKRIHDLCLQGNEPVHEVINHLLKAGGKRIRPTLAFISASFKSADWEPTNWENLVDAASAIEMIHMASLVHDDIIDQATTRRGTETINQKWGNLTAVLAGDYLFSSAFNLLTARQNYPVLLSVTNAIRLMCEGEINQAAQTYNYRQTEENYLDNIYKKTACLFAASCQAGAITALLPAEHVRLINHFGLYLGYAYQILDDILDLIGDPNELGKPVGSDLARGILTLPILRLLQDEQQGAWLKPILDRQQISAEEIALTVTRLADGDAFLYSLDRVFQMFDAAYQSIYGLPQVPARLAMWEIAGQLLEKPLLMVEKSLTSLGLTMPLRRETSNPIYPQQEQLNNQTFAADYPDDYPLDNYVSAWQSKFVFSFSGQTIG
ncbi:MAG: polyprenyl synthetase family protein [Bacillota bacterium]